MPVEDRRAMIIHAITPLLLEQGRDVTTKQIAEAAGIAEGTIFRAFGDKESLIEATIAHYLDPEPMRRRLREIDVDLSLEAKVLRMIVVLRERYTSVFRIMAVLGRERRPMSAQRTVFAAIVGEALAADAARLNWEPERVAHIIRLVTFASAFPQINDGVEFSTEDLCSIVLYGIAGIIPETTDESS